MICSESHERFSLQLLFIGTLYTGCNMYLSKMTSVKLSISLSTPCIHTYRCHNSQNWF